MRLKELNESPKWDPWDYSVYLERRGYKWPMSETTTTYISITGQSEYKPFNNRYGLVTYQPKKREYNFTSVEEAEKFKDRIQPNMWQILDMVTGRIISDPNKPGKLQEHRMRLREIEEDFDVDEVLSEIEEMMEDINDYSMSAEGNEEQELERDYQALHAIQNVLENFKIAKRKDLLDRNVFVFDIDSDRDRYGAIHVQVKNSTAEIKWIGTYGSVRGKSLWQQALKKLHQFDVNKVTLDAKWESEGFYSKLGFKSSGQKVNDPIGGNKTPMYKDIS